MKEKQNEPHGSNFALFQCRSTYMIFICFKPFVGYYWYIYMYTPNFQVSIKLNCMSGIQYIILNKYPRNNILTLRAVINTLCFFAVLFHIKTILFYLHIKCYQTLIDVATTNFILKNLCCMCAKIR